MRALRKGVSALKEKEPRVKRVLLFGSFARGDYTPHSDIDLLLELDRIDLPFPERAERFRYCFDKIPFDINLLVYSSEELRQMKRQGNLFIRDILREARELG